MGLARLLFARRGSARHWTHQGRSLARRATRELRFGGPGFASCDVALGAVAETLQVGEGADERLRDLAEQLDSYGWAAELLDHRWHLVWASDEFLTMYGERDPERIGLGDHVLVSRMR